MKVQVLKNGKSIMMEEEFANKLVEGGGGWSFAEEVESPTMEELFAQYKEKFDKDAPQNIKRETLIEKLK